MLTFEEIEKLRAQLRQMHDEAVLDETARFFAGRAVKVAVGSFDRTVDEWRRYLRRKGYRQELQSTVLRYLEDALTRELKEQVEEAKRRHEQC